MVVVFLGLVAAAAVVLYVAVYGYMFAGEFGVRGVLLFMLLHAVHCMLCVSVLQASLEFLVALLLFLLLQCRCCALLYVYGCRWS